MTNRSRAFTLAEVLAAIVLLALLAVAAYPLAHRLAVGESKLGERQVIERALRTNLAAMHGKLEVGERPAPGLAPLHLRCEPLPRVDSVPLDPPRCWWRVEIVDPEDDRVLASTVMLGAAP